MLEAEGFRLLVQKTLLEEFEGITVDYLKSGWTEGFRVTPGKAQEDGCGGCSC